MNTFKLYEQLKAAFPEESAEALARILSGVIEDIQNTVTKQDFAELKAVVRDLAEAQKRTEERAVALEAAMEKLAQSQQELAQAQQRTEVRVSSLEATVEKLAQAQQRTEERLSSLEATVEKLAQAQQRTEERLNSLEATVEKLAQAQQRTEERLNSLEAAVEKLAEAQRRTEEAMQAGFRDLNARFGELHAGFRDLNACFGDLRAGFRDLNSRFGVVGSRWGDQAEGAFRRGLLEMVSRVGYTVEHYQGQDPEGFINYTPRSFDLDVLVHNGQLVVAEIKSNASGADVTEFYRSVLLFESQTGRRASQRILVAVTIQAAALERAKDLGIIVATDFAPLTR